MSDDEWIVIPNWDKFQHYNDREPVWIKVYLELRSRDDWRRLTLAERGLLCSLWVEYAASMGQLRHADVTQRVAQKTRRQHWVSLLRAGFIEFAASKPLAIRYQVASPRALARRRGREEEEKDALAREEEFPALLNLRETPELELPPWQPRKPYRCPVCTDTFLTETELFEHADRAHLR